LEQRPRRTETPVTTHVAVLQGLRWGPSSAGDLITQVAKRTKGRVNIHVGLVYKTLKQLTDRGFVRRWARLGDAALYELTPLGSRRAKQEAAALGRLFVTS
jgi:DNA-binding PadR family transcriptional regulator